MTLFKSIIQAVTFAIILANSPTIAKSQYLETFDFPETHFTENNMPGWNTHAGDGDIDFHQRYTGNSVIFRINPINDKRNIWYAFAHKNIVDFIDVEKLSRADYELRMETRVRTSHAPRRINMYLSGYSESGHLREFDIAHANQWTTLSMVTENIKPSSESRIVTQVSLMDWGISELMTLEVDYIKVDVVKKNEQNSQFGLPLIYRPPLKKSVDFTSKLEAEKSVTLDSAYPATNFYTLDSAIDTTRILAVNNTSIAMLTWDFSKLIGKTVKEGGQLELCTYALARMHDSPKDFGEIRVYEILDGFEDWDEKTITYNDVFGRNHIERTINGQTVFDTHVNPRKDGITTITISKPVLDRLISGQTKGLAILPLGYISAHFYAGDSNGKAPTLFFNLVE